MLKIVVVVPTCRPESMGAFVKAWTPLFRKHDATLITVWDGDEPGVSVDGSVPQKWTSLHEVNVNRDLFCRRTDACRNIGFVWTARHMDFDVLFTVDDDCYPCKSVGGVPEDFDPIQSHLDALDRRVPLSWMNTAHDTDLYLRGVPYGVRNEAPVMLSHGVWVGTPDFDGETQLRLEAADKWECGCGCTTVSPGPDDNPIKCTACGRPAREGGRPNRVPHSLPYYVGPVPRGVMFGLCGMSVMVKREALPYLYYAPMGRDSGVVCPQCVGAGGVPDVSGFVCSVCKGSGSPLHRFADIFMGVFLKRVFDEKGWGCVTGYSTVHHTRASNARKNYEQEKLGREWMERIDVAFDGLRYVPPDDPFYRYFTSYADKRARYEELVAGLLRKDG